MKLNVKNTLFPAMLLGIMLLNFGCEKEEPEAIEQPVYPVHVAVISPGERGQHYDWGSYMDGETQPISGANIYLYGSQEAYLLREAPLYEGESDENGLYYLELTEPDTFWVYVEKGQLNNQRYARYDGIKNSCGSRFNSVNYLAVTKSDKSYLEEWRNNEIVNGENNVFAVLTPNPTQLQFTVYHNGQVVEGAKTTLYFSEEAYNQDIPAWQEIEELKPSYGIFTPELIAEYKNLGSINNICILNSLVRNTDSSGEVYFDNLEPRQYWFRIEKEGLSNEGGTFKLDEALPGNPDINTSITVGIQ